MAAFGIPSWGWLFGQGFCFRMVVDAAPLFWVWCLWLCMESLILAQDERWRRA